MPTFSRTDSKVLSVISWHTNIVLGFEELLDSNFRDFFTKVLEADKELLGTSTDVVAARKVLQIGPCPTGNINDTHLYKAVNRVLAYRILDVCQWIKKSEPSLHTITVPLLVEPHNNLLDKLRARKMEDWPSVLNRAKKYLDSIMSEESKSAASEPSQDRTQCLLRSISSFTNQNKGHKWLSNFEVAAMHLSVHMKGHWDVSDSPLKVVAQSEILQIQGSSQMRLSCLRNPLDTALALSPIALFQDKLMWCKSTSSKFILETLQVFSGNKPQAILKVERELWLALIDIAKGEATLPRILAALNSIEAIVQSEGIAEISGWFSGRESVVRRAALEAAHAGDDENGRNSTLTENIPPAQQHADVQNTLPRPPAQGDIQNTPSTQRNPVNNANDIDLQNPRQPDKSGSSGSQAPRGPDKKQSKKGVGGRRPRKKRRKAYERGQREREFEREDSEQEVVDEEQEDFLNFEDLDLTLCKSGLVNRRTLLIVTPLASAWESDSDAAQSPIPCLIEPSDCSTTIMTGHREVSLYGPSGQRQPYVPKFHMVEELKVFYELEGMTNMPFEIIAVLSNEQLKEPATQEIFLLKHFVVNDAQLQRYNFDDFALGRVFGARNKLPLIDYSQEGRVGQGTVQHLLDSDKAINGNIISTERIPVSPSEYLPPRSLASDGIAWKYTYKEPHCNLRVNFPELQTRWFFAATRGAFGEWKVEKHGFCTFINVLAGSVWVVISKPNAQGRRMFADTTAPTNPMDPAGSNLRLWDVEPILIGEGSKLILRPNTPYRVLTIQSTICAGGLFYSMLNITESCFGVFQSFLSPSTPHKPASFKASRLLLSRILIYLHQQYVLEGTTSVLNSDLPDLETMDGVLAVLSVINIAELANVLHPDTYQAGVNPEERVFLMHVRKLGRHVLQWLSDNYLIEPAPYPGNLISTVRKIPPLWRMYLHHQADALQSAMRSMERAGVSPSIPGLTYKALSVQLIQCIGPFDELLGYAETFAWEAGTHKVARRCTPLCSIFNGNGETQDDRKWIEAGRSLLRK